MLNDKVNMVDTPDLTVFKTVFYYSILIILLPITTFFSCKIILFDSEYKRNNLLDSI